MAVLAIGLAALAIVLPIPLPILPERLPIPLPIMTDATAGRAAVQRMAPY
jgi:hypothetical protein